VALLGRLFCYVELTDIRAMEPIKNSQTRFSRAILGGIIAAILAGLALIPFVQIIMDRYLVIDFASEPIKNSFGDNILRISAFLYFFLCLCSAGFVSSRIARAYEYQIAWILFGITAIIVMAFSAPIPKNEARDILLALFAMLAGSLFGAWLGLKYKQKKKMNQENAAR
jgi:hypothetical protein